MIGKVAAPLGLLLLAGCALPLPVQVASWVIDGISLLATGKSMPEHGLSVVTRKDCVVLRGILGEGLCVDDVTGSTAIAAFENNPADTASLMESTQNAGPLGRLQVVEVARLFIGAEWGEEAARGGAAIAEVAAPRAVMVAAADVADGPRSAGGAEARAVVMAEIEVARFPASEEAVDGADEVAALTDFETAAGAAGETDSDRAYFDAGAGPEALAEAPTGFAAGADLEADAAGAAAAEEGTVFLDAGAPPSSGEAPRPPPEIVRDAFDISALGPPRAIGIEGAASRMAAEAAERAADLDAVASPAQDRAAADPVREARRGGLYFVVGSFGYLANAKQLAVQYAALGTAVVTARLDGRRLYRVVVGPFSDTDRQARRRRIIEAGVYDAWAISLDPEQWTVAGRAGQQASELASRLRAAHTSQ